ncbi:hypothetical protein BGW80DRAFT_1312878 [Lactifluus volemus]|nr:hypothetical protein BGW80DRAFT_1312878 [Lactifluus volemus]
MSRSTSTSKQSSLDALNAESSRLRLQIASEIDEADDPLELYDRFVKWIFDKYPREHFASSGLVELLEEATRRYNGDPSYKSDLRYLKLWTLYASLVDKPSAVYKFILTNGIGTVYALLFEDYALALERDGRCGHSLFCIAQHSHLQSYSAADEVYRAGIQRKARPVERLKKRYDEFRRRTSSKPPKPPPAAQVALSKAKGSTEADLLRRQPLKNYENPGGTAQSKPSAAPSHVHPPKTPREASPSSQFAYAGSPRTFHGSLGQKVGPPPPSEFSRDPSSTTRVNFNDDGSKTTRNYTARKSLAGAEPTVTINTKAALADVFGMYNSPEKTTRMPGTKHAPVRAIEPVSPLSLLPQTRPAPVETAPSFTPFVDENTSRKENAAPPKFKPLLSNQKGKLSKRREDKPSARNLTLLDDGQAPFKVFSRPPEKDSVFSRPGSIAPLADDAPLRPASGTRAPLRQKTEEEVVEVPSEDDEDEDEDQDQDYQGVSPHLAMDYEEDNGDAEPAHSTPFGGRFGQFNVMTPITERTLEYTFTGRFSVLDGDISALGERVFGHPDAIEVAERLAAEVRGDSAFAERQAASSRDDGALKGDLELQDATALVEEKTGTLNLSDAPLVGSTFKPPNPCNPSDPEVISTLLSLLPAVPEHYNVPRDAQLLDGLQKFARKLMRTSGSSTGRLSSQRQTFPLQLGERHFSVYEKLGEGGFGAVFATKIVEATAGGHDEDEDEDEDDDDDEKSHRVAIKVVNPSNAWEFCILRKVHADLPERLRSSVIHPQALYTYNDESFLILDLCTQGSLLDIINRAGKAGVSQQGACLDELLVIFFTIELLRLLEGLHNTGIIHGDLKIDNCLVRLEDVPSSSSWAAQYDPSGADGWRNKGIKLIDFGRAIDTRMFPSGQAFIAEWATDARDCVEMREGRPWTYEADYFGLAGIYIEASSIVRVTPPPRQQAEGGKGSGGLRYKLATAFKRYWQTDLWTRLFDVLLNPCFVRPDGALPVSDTLALLRAEMEAWLQANCNRSSNTLKGLLKKVELSVIRGD